MSTIVIRPSGARKPGGPPLWAVQLRWAHCGGTEYATFAHVEEPVARAIIAAGPADWLFGDPRDDGGDRATMPDLSEFAPATLTTAALETLIARLTRERDEARAALDMARSDALEDAADAASRAAWKHEGDDDYSRGMDRGARDVLSERTRQIDAEGWSRAHDDAHSRGELALAAACYALSAVGVRGDDPASLRFWPFDDSWWRPGTPRRDLVKAAALILAEIERLDRAMVAASPIAAKEDSQ